MIYFQSKTINAKFNWFISEFLKLKSNKTKRAHIVKSVKKKLNIARLEKRA